MESKLVSLQLVRKQANKEATKTNKQTKNSDQYQTMRTSYVRDKLVI